jgi:hypothetical protein
MDGLMPMDYTGMNLAKIFKIYSSAPNTRI